MTDTINTPAESTNTPAPSIEGTPAPVLPMLDRGTAPQSAAPTSDAHLEGQPGTPALPATNETNESVQTEPATAGSLHEMIGQELMQDPGVSLVANSLMRLMQGADHNRAFAKALEEGDTRFIDKAYLIEKLGAEAADEAIRAAEYLSTYADQKAAQMKQELYSSVQGGEQALQLAAKHFRASAPKEEQRAIAQMLDSGDMDIMKYAVGQIMRFGQQLPNGPQNPQARHTQTPTALQPLSRAEFGKMVLQKPNMTEQEYQHLSARLAAGLQQS